MISMCIAYVFQKHFELVTKCILQYMFFCLAQVEEKLRDKGVFVKLSWRKLVMQHQVKYAIDCPYSGVLSGI